MVCGGWWILWVFVIKINDVDVISYIFNWDLGVKCIVDDVFIYGRDDVDYDGNLEGFMKRC